LVRDFEAEVGSQTSTIEYDLNRLAYLIKTRERQPKGKPVSGVEIEYFKAGSANPDWDKPTGRFIKKYGHDAIQWEDLNALNAEFEQYENGIKCQQDGCGIAMKLEGFFKAPHRGKYVFKLGSKQFAKLIVNDKTIMGLHVKD
jgi:hypothetical protein